MADFKVSGFGQMLQNVGKGVYETGNAITAIKDTEQKMQKAKADIDLQTANAVKQRSDNMIAADALVQKAQQDLFNYKDKKDQEAYVMNKLPTINSIRQSSGLPPLQPGDLISGGEGMSAQRKAYADSYANTVGILSDPSRKPEEKFKALTELETQLNTASPGMSESVLKTATESLKTLKEQFKDDRNFQQQQAIAGQNAEAADARMTKALNAREDQQDKKAQTQADQQTTRAVDQASAQIKRDPLLNKLQEQSISLDVANGLLDQVGRGNSVATSALGIKEAKAMGEVGVMTDSDVVRYIQAKKFDQKMQDKLGMFFQGKPTKMTQDEIRITNEIVKTFLENKVMPRYYQYIDNMTNNHNLSEEDAIMRLGLGRSVKSGTGPAQKTTKSQGGTVKTSSGFTLKK